MLPIYLKNFSEMVGPVYNLSRPCMSIYGDHMADPNNLYWWWHKSAAYILCCDQLVLLVNYGIELENLMTNKMAIQNEKSGRMFVDWLFMQRWLMNMAFTMQLGHYIL